MNNLKQRSIEYLTTKLNECKTISYFQDESGERKAQDIEKYTNLLKYSESKDESYFQNLSKLANAVTTHYQAGGHTKAQLNKNAADRYRSEVTETPSDSFLLSFGVFNGDGAV